MHHLLHLLFPGAAPSGNGIFDLVGRVLQNPAARERSFGEGETAGLADTHCSAHIVLKEHLLDRNNIGFELGN